MTINSPAPTIDRTGITAPTLPDLIQYLEDQYREIFGHDVYLGPDSQDGQFLSILASAINDSNAVAVSVYNAFSPATAQGAGLSSVVKINGLRRHVSTYSTVDLNLTGVAGTIINSGVVKDVNNYKWDLPSTITLDSNGQRTATATCQTLGAVVALPNTVTQIQTPQRGWQAVTNPTDASTGANTEQDGALRGRQAISTALPSQTVMDGIIGAVANVAGVTRYRGYENATNTTDANGLAPHTIALVAEGGTALNIATAISNKKTPGTGLAGNTTVQVTDPVGMINTIQFYRPTQVTITVDIALTALPGYLSSTGQSIQQAVADFINNQPIGGTLYHGQLYGPANLDGGANSGTFNITSLTLARGTNTPAVNNVTLAFDEVAVCAASNVILTVS